MHWNYRIVDMARKNAGEPLFEVQEVFYNQDGVPIGHGDTSIMSETIEGVAKVLDSMQEALAQPVLKPKDFKKERA